MAMVSAVAVPVIFVGSGVADAVPFNLGPCAGDLTGTTFTLGGNCSATAPILVPALVTTVDGGGFAISATDAGGAQWNGGILTNANPGQTMNVQNLTIAGPAAGFQLCTQAGNVLYGIWFNDASGSVNNVTVDHIFQFQNGAFGSCQTGRAIRADGGGTARTVTITNSVVTDYQKSGFEARGSMTMNVSGSTAGPPHDLRGLMAQNAVSIVGATGTIANNTIHGSGDQQPGVGGSTDGTGVLLFGAHDVTVDHNTITGAGTNLGVAVAADTTNAVISFNQIGRTAPDNPDPSGFGVVVDAPTVKLSPAALQPAQGPSTATLICNTFSGWNTNILGAVQMSCTPLPNGTECVAYAASVFSVEGGTAPFTWSVASGTLPPGLSFAAADGSITGTPTATGTFDFTVMVTDSSAPTLSATQAQTITIVANCAPESTPTTEPPATEPPTAAPTSAPSVVPTMGELPPTGADSSMPLYIGLAVLGLGSLIVIVTTRRRARHS
jgi:Putative Ig domain/Right handed beta helix region